MYSTGDPRNPRDNDPRFGSVEEAITSALAYEGSRVLAVWRDEDGEIIALIHEGIVYRP